jgi:hypothetical protein
MSVRRSQDAVHARAADHTLEHTAPDGTPSNASELPPRQRKRRQVKFDLHVKGKTGPTEPAKRDTDVAPSTGPARPASGEVNLSLSGAGYLTLSVSGILVNEATVADRALDALIHAATEVEVLDAFSRLRSLAAKGFDVRMDAFVSACAAKKESSPGS